MNSGNKNLARKAVAVVVMVTFLDLVGISPVVMLFVTGVAFVVWFIGRRSGKRQVEEIFQFYMSADAILRDSDRRWYGFEVAEVIEDGERILELMPDCPPLHYFALGALYYQVGNYEATAEYLSRLLEDERYDERHRAAPSPQLRRYVGMLRTIEYEPSLAPQSLAAVRSLERARRKHAEHLLTESRQFLNSARTAGRAVVAETSAAEVASGLLAEPDRLSPPLSSVSPPPPITEVLHDVYRDEKQSC